MIAEPLVKTKAKKRTKCPFYGFYNAMGHFMDQDGNQCPLITGHYAPCQLEIAGLDPDWSSCYVFNTAENKEVIENILKKSRIAPNEYWPKGEKSFGGISFKDWYDHITKGKVISEKQRPKSFLRSLVDRLKK